MRFALALPMLLWAAPLAAQRERVRLEIIVSSASILDGPSIATANLLADPRAQDPLVNGAFPTGIHFRLELWRKGGWFDNLDGRAEWDVLVSYDPTKQLYNVVRRQDNQLLENFGGFPTLVAAEAQFGGPFHVALRPDRSGRYYYNLIVEIRTLTETDLDALQQWLRGTKQAGKSNPLSAFGRGLGKLLSRVLGGDKRHYEERSGVIPVP